MQKSGLSRYVRGFTIVELLIVIVIIGILAALVIVAYNGIQQRAENTKTISAAQAFVKAFRAYAIDNNDIYPSQYNSCLGEGYQNDGFNGDGTQQCSMSASYIERAALHTALRPYLGGKIPTPSFKPVGSSALWWKGIAYNHPDGYPRINIALGGVASCPAISGTTLVSTQTLEGGVGCRLDMR